MSMAPPAGWYEDPVGRAPLRWWDGAGWTQETRHQPPEPPAPTAASNESLPSRRQVHGRLDDAAENPYAIDRPASTSASAFADIQPQGALFADLVPLESSAEPTPAEPFAHLAPVEPFANLAPSGSPFAGLTPTAAQPGGFAAYTPAVAPARVRLTRQSTPAVWLLAFTPFLSAGVYYVSLWLALALPNQPWLGLLVGLIGLLLTVAFAMRDRSKLRELGHERPANPAWVLLGVLPYLIARLVSTIRNTGKGVAPLVVFVINGIVGGMLVLLITAALTAVLMRYYQ